MATPDSKFYEYMAQKYSKAYTLYLGPTFRKKEHCFNCSAGGYFALENFILLLNMLPDNFVQI